MADTCFVEGLNTLPEQVQLNKENIKKLSDLSTTQAEQLQTLTTKVDTNTANIATNTTNIATNTESIDSIKQSYLLKSDASNTYATKTELNNDYLKKSDASDTYLTKTDASNTYVTIEDYDERFDTGDIVLSTQGFNKIKTMAEKEGTTITLIAPTDFYDYVQVTNTNEIILSVHYNGNPIYRNIHLMPNQTIDDYTAYQDATEYSWYTGHAMLNLPSQHNGYFAISYQNDTNNSQLILTLIALY